MKSSTHLKIVEDLITECKELAGKVIRVCQLCEDGSDGPELQLEFTDGTSFVAGLKVQVSLEAKYLRSDGGGSKILKEYIPVISTSKSKGVESYGISPDSDLSR